jgi:hypothetical protein
LTGPWPSTRLVGGGQDVQVADGLAAPAQAAGRLHRRHAGKRPQVRGDRLGHRQGIAQGHAVRTGGHGLDAGEDPRLRFLAHPRKVAQAAGSGGRLQGGQVDDPAGFPEQLDLLGTHVGDLQQVRQRGGDLLGEFRVVAEATGIQQLGHLGRDRRAEAGNTVQAALAVDGRQVAPQGAHALRRAAVGEHLEAALALDLQQVADPLQDGGYFRVGHVPSGPRRRLTGQ